ncbi:sulfatase-like hydrolase/transferase [Portibacter lacus]|uniref:N-acetylgalactosamine-6-sulfatase n=1 Tax=Portibacter lacus TaxID=1099794 RepID=A0AA37SPK2_9BACT|nr:sulfatase-like hydrolase/transferase [Portibacter lacus]GLR17077.1 N-acetylgalactosamine-6-sulfatase [Portibacter lacus]
MKKLLSLCLLATFLLSGTSVFCQNSNIDLEEKPNIIFIFTDDLGVGDIGVLYQNERKRLGVKSEPWTSTPQLDRMAQEGAILSNHYSAAPVCAPSRASLLTGLSQGHANVRNNQFDKALADNHTMANVLQKAGYNTAAIGKWGLQGDKRWSKDGDAWPGHPNKRGFDYFYGYMRHKDGHEHYPHEGVYRGAKSVYENEREITSGLNKCFTGDLWTAIAKKWITDQVKEDEKPFFMFLAYDTPHAVLELPTQAYPKGGGLNGGVQWIGKEGEMINTASGEVDSYVHDEYARATYDDDRDETTAEVPWPDTYKRYATGVRRIDDGVGDIIQLLKDLDIDDNTMIVFSSDNGPSKESYLPKGYVSYRPDFFNSFGEFDGIKRDVLEGGVRVPLIVRWPKKIKANSVVDMPSISYDWLPTFTDAAGIPGPAIIDGVSLLPSLTGSGKQRESLVYVEYQNNGKTPKYEEFSPKNRNRVRKEMQMIRKGDLIGLRYNIGNVDDDFEIYDIVNDPQQSKDLAQQDEEMQALNGWMKDRVLQIRRPDTSAARPYDSAVVPAVNVKKKKGLLYKSFAGNFPWLPEMVSMKEESTGMVKSINDFKLDKKAGNLLLIEGFIEVPEGGEYVFTLSAKEKALMKIHDATIIDADYNYEANDEISAEILLEKGVHPIKIYVQNSGKAKAPIDLQWQGPNFEKAEISGSVLFH